MYSEFKTIHADFVVNAKLFLCDEGKENKEIVRSSKVAVIVGGLSRKHTAQRLAKDAFMAFYLFGSWEFP